MISPTDRKHHKHAQLLRANMGEWGRNELAILGTDCGGIRQLAYSIIQHLPQYKIAYIDADHNSVNAERQSVSAASSGAYIEYINKISFTRLDINTQPNVFQKRALLNDCDLVLVNGNHFTAAKQIIIIDEKKPLEKKLNKLTDAQFVLLKDTSLPIPDYIRSKVPELSSLYTDALDNTAAIVHRIQQLIIQQYPVVNGLVLSGGQSTRMGKDKGALDYYGKTQREHTYGLLKDVCAKSFISCNDEQAKLIHLLPVIKDAFLGLGPLGGILSAFQQNPNVAWLVVACDLPLLTKDIIEHLVAHRNPSKMATAFLDSEGKFPEPLVTIWESKAYPVLLQFLAQGYSCPRKALINSDVEIVHAPDVAAFTNVNTAEAYNELLIILRNKHDG